MWAYFGLLCVFETADVEIIRYTNVEILILDLLKSLRDA
jgi:hypothetical protein